MRLIIERQWFKIEDRHFLSKFYSICLNCIELSVLDLKGDAEAEMMVMKMVLLLVFSLLSLVTVLFLWEFNRGIVLC